MSVFQNVYILKILDFRVLIFTWALKKNCSYSTSISSEGLMSIVGKKTWNSEEGLILFFLSFLMFFCICW